MLKKKFLEMLVGVFGSYHLILCRIMVAGTVKNPIRPLTEYRIICFPIEMVDAGSDSFFESCELTPVPQ